jgi:hypothetical protein
MTGTNDDPKLFRLRQRRLEHTEGIAQAPLLYARQYERAHTSFRFRRVSFTEALLRSRTFFR